MVNKAYTIYFWQRIISPHMAGLAKALVHAGHRVVLNVNLPMTESRRKQGWDVPSMPTVEVNVVQSTTGVEGIVGEACENSVHIFEGIGNVGVVSSAKRLLAKRGMRHWVMMEAVADYGIKMIPRRVLYRAQFWRQRNDVEGVLAIGWRTGTWLIRRGVEEKKVFPFVYPLEDTDVPEEALARSTVTHPCNEICLLFVGQFIRRKRLDLLISALKRIIGRGTPAFRLRVVGSGSLEGQLRSAAEHALGDRVEWMGKLRMPQVRQLMASADCLILPSKHDGWGAVVSEALMVGTPAIVSAGCGSAGVALASGHGKVFPTGDLDALTKAVEAAIRSGKVCDSERRQLACWARRLGARVGATQLTEIIGSVRCSSKRPAPHWPDSI